MKKEITQVTHIKTNLEGFRYPGFNESRETKKQNDKYVELDLPTLILDRLRQHQELNIDDLNVKVTEDQLGKALEVLLKNNQIVSYSRVGEGHEVICATDKTL